MKNLVSLLITVVFVPLFCQGQIIVGKPPFNFNPKYVDQSKSSYSKLKNHYPDSMHESEWDTVNENWNIVNRHKWKYSIRNKLINYTILNEFNDTILYRVFDWFSNDTIKEYSEYLVDSNRKSFLHVNVKLYYNLKNELDSQAIVQRDSMGQNLLKSRTIYKYDANSYITRSNYDVWNKDSNDYLFGGVYRGDVRYHRSFYPGSKRVRMLYENRYDQNGKASPYLNYQHENTYFPGTLNPEKIKSFSLPNFTLSQTISFKDTSALDHHYESKTGGGGVSGIGHSLYESYDGSLLNYTYDSSNFSVLADTIKYNKVGHIINEIHYVNFGQLDIENINYSTIIDKRGDVKSVILISELNSLYNWKKKWEYFSTPNSISDYNRDQISVFPNPIEDNSELNLKGLNVEHTLYRIYSINGHLQDAGRMKGVKINIGSLSPGVYYLQIGSIQTIKFIVQ